jgi:hypothetical protein
LRSAITARSGNTQVVAAGETIDKAVTRWTGVIRRDRTRLDQAFGSNRTPENGFLNLHRDLVVALRDKACLAWGGIDLGANQSGDMMHFDCRVSGLGRAVLPTSGHNIVAGHPCLAASAIPAREYEGPTFRPGVTYSVPVFPQKWTFTAKTLPIKVAIYVSKAASTSKKIELLVFAHGDNVCSPVAKNPPMDFITGKPFELGKIVENSGRPMVLIVPFMDWEHFAKNKMGMKCRSTWHKLGDPVNLNGVLAEVMKEVGGVINVASVPSRLVISGHSHAYAFLDPLAAAHANPEMSKGVLAALTHVWAFDTTYTCPPVWDSWLMSPKVPQISVIYKDSGKTKYCGSVFKCLADKRKLWVATATEQHCAMPGIRLPQMLKTLP